MDSSDSADSNYEMSNVWPYQLKTASNLGFHMEPLIFFSPGSFCICGQYRHVFGSYFLAVLKSIVFGVDYDPCRVNGPFTKPVKGKRKLLI